MTELESPHPMQGKSITTCREEGEAMVAAWKTSGLSMRAYAQAHGLNERRLGAWRRRLAPEEKPETDVSSERDHHTFIPVTVRDTDALTVVVNDHVHIRVESGSDLSLLRRTVAALTC